MTTLGVLASWAAALFGAWAFVAGLLASPTRESAPSALAPYPERASRGHAAAARSARRALVAAALLALVATLALLQLLLSGDFTVSYVARTVASNVPAPARVAALFQLPAGAVLPTAALVALFGAAATRRAHATIGTAVSGAVVMALIAASLAAQPFATLPWVPADGLGLAPDLLQSVSVVGHAARTVAVAAATAWAARAADAPAGGAGVGARVESAAETSRVDVFPLMTLAAIAIAMWGEGRGAFLAGLTATPEPGSAWSGAMLPALVAVACSWRNAPVWAPGSAPGSAPAAPASAALAASLGTLGLLVSAVLAGASGGKPPLALFAVAVLSLVSAAAGGLLAAGGAGRERAVGTTFAGHGPSPAPPVLRSAAVLLAMGGGASLWLAGDVARVGTAGQWALAAAIIVAGVQSVLFSGARARGWLIIVATATVGAAVAWWLAATTAVALLWALAAGVALGAAVAWASRPHASGGAWHVVLVFVAASVASLAALGEGAARTEQRVVRVGARTTLVGARGASVDLAHQGVSRYQDRNAHVVAVALEASRGDRTLAVLTAERREYVDGRDERLGPQVAPPAVLVQPMRELRATLEDLDADETVTLRFTLVPFALGWTAAVVCLLASLVLGVAPRRSVAPPGPEVHPSA